MVVTVGSITTRYATVIGEMNVFFRGYVIVVAKGVIVIEGFPLGGTILQRTVDEVNQVEGVKSAVPMLFIMNTSQLQESVQLLPTDVTMGIPSRNWSILLSSISLEEGGHWPSADSTKKEVVVGPSVADQYGLTADSEMHIKNQKVTVAGVLDTRSMLLSRTILMPLDLAQDIYGYHNLISLVIVEPDDNVVETRELAESIEAEIGNVKALTDNERNKFIQPILNELHTWDLAVNTVLFVMDMILVTIVSLMNVSERRRDFATLDAIGASKKSIFRMVIIETGLMGFLGCLLGILLGTVATLLLASFYTRIPLSLFFLSLFDTVPPIIMVRILISTVVVSCIAGFIPAIAAAKTNIAEALRAEY